MHPVRTLLALLLVPLLSNPATAQGAKPGPKPDAPPVATEATRSGQEQRARKKVDDGLDPTVARDVSHYNLQRGKPANGGYDPVAYFPEGGGKPKQGRKEHAFVYRGATWWFATPENMAAFQKDPRRYEPAYGGWCAYAMGKTGEKVEVDPKSFRIQGGRLFLFYKSFFNDTRSSWIEDETTLLPKADANWRRTSGEAPPAPKPAKQDAQGVQRPGEQRGANGR